MVWHAPSAPSKGVKRYFFLVYQNEAYSKQAESSGQGWSSCAHGLGRPICGN